MKTLRTIGAKTSTLLIVLLTGATAVYAWSAQHPALLAISVGALGGLAHEVAQSRGKFILPRLGSDGYYLGALTGLVLGACAGALSVQGLLTNVSVPPATPEAMRAQLYTIAFTGFGAGLALKGIAEAVTTETRTGGDRTQTPTPDLRTEQ